MPLPRSVREAIERYEAKHGATRDGYPLRGPGGYFTEGMERRRVKKLFADLPRFGTVADAITSRPRPVAARRRAVVVATRWADSAW
ncbi:hypothetical protein ACFY8C_20960 [Streptomyces flavochromogenes]|uniref:Uncharacterized protein n=1 Tax=Streptomyces flavochromogenes TaxID=68199 RepID=A0ABW6XTF3_9ACTN